MVVERYGFAFATKDVEYLFFLGDAGEGLIDDLKFFERLCRGMQLPDSAVNQDQAGQRFVLLL